MAQKEKKNILLNLDEKDQRKIYLKATIRQTNKDINRLQEELDGGSFDLKEQERRAGEIENLQNEVDKFVDERETLLGRTPVARTTPQPKEKIENIVIPEKITQEHPEVKSDTSLKEKNKEIVALNLKMGGKDANLIELGLTQEEIDEAKSDIEKEQENRIKSITAELISRIESGKTDEVSTKTNEELLQRLIDLNAPQSQIEAIRKSMNPEKADDITETGELEDERTPEEKRVDETRWAYLREYNRCKKIAKEKASIFDLFKSKEKIAKKEEQYLDQRYKDAKDLYDKARIDMGNDLFNKEKAKLERDGVSGPELELKLKEYKATEILTKTIIEEHQKLIDAKAEGAPINPALWKKLLHGYLSIKPKWKRVALSTILFLPAAAYGATGASIIAGVGLPAYAGIKFLASMGIGAVSANLARGIDRLTKNKDARFRQDQEISRSSLADRFASEEITLQEYERETGFLDEEKRKRDRDRAIVKGFVGIAIGIGAGAAAYGAIGHGLGVHHGDPTTNIPHGPNPHPTTIEHPPLVKTDSIEQINRPVINQDTIPSPKINQVDTSNIHPDNNIVDPTKITTTPDTNIPTTSHAPVEVAVGKGHGAIQTIHELQDKLKSEYPDVTKAPPSVQHILNTKADRLAIEYGMFKPGQDAESAIMKLGSTFKVDQEGNLTFHQVGTDNTTILEKGIDSKVSEVYAGKMIDGDHSGTHLASHPKGTQTSDFEKTHPQTTPEGVKTDIDQTGLKTNLSEFERMHPQTTPENIKISTSEPAIKPVLTEQKVPDEVINTGAISPTRGIYNTGEASTLDINGVGPNTTTPEVSNGFTREVPMTNQELQEHLNKTPEIKNIAPAQNTVNGGNNINTPKTVGAIESNTVTNTIKIENIEADPRHLENAADVKHTFGGDNVRIDRPDSDTVNGIEYENWNKATDHLFEQKGLKFNSYDQYEKERELQELFGHGEQKIKYVESLSKNVEVVEMDYFRQTPEYSIVSKIPAKYFFDFNDVKLVDGTPISQIDLDKLVETGVLKESVVNPSGGAMSYNYTFTHHDQLERLQKMYERLTPKAKDLLANDKPIGNETIEKYVERMTHRIYETENGTLYGLKKDINWDNNVARSINNPAQPVSGGNISPTRGVYNTGNYNPNSGLANRAVNNIMGYLNRWTH